MAQHEVRARVDTKVIGHKDLANYCEAKWPETWDFTDQQGQHRVAAERQVHQQEADELETVYRFDASQGAFGKSNKKVKRDVHTTLLRHSSSH